MKTVFKYSYRNSRFYFLSVLFVLCVVLAAFSGKEIIPALVILFGLTMLQCSSYEVTDDGFLKTYSVRIVVMDIQKLVYQKDRIDVYHQMPNGKIRMSAFFPVDRKGFVNKLKEMNPDIQIV